jgi:hypothetical protein
LPKGKWVKEFPKVLWSLRTTVARPTGYTPFRLLFAAEAMTPEECKTKSFRVGNELDQCEELSSKDALEEVRLQAAKNLASYQKETRKWRDRNVSEKTFSPGDLVLRRFGTTASVGKTSE